MRQTLSAMLAVLLMSAMVLTGCGSNSPQAPSEVSSTTSSVEQTTSQDSTEDQTPAQEETENAQTTEAPKATITYFFNEKCPSCQKAAPMVEVVKTRYGDAVKWVTLTKGEEEYAKYVKEWGIEYTPTWVIHTADGEEIGRLVGADTTVEEFDEILLTVGVTPVSLP